MAIELTGMEKIVSGLVNYQGDQITVARTERGLLVTGFHSVNVTFYGVAGVELEVLPHLEIIIVRDYQGRETFFNLALAHQETDRLIFENQYIEDDERGLAQIRRVNTTIGSVA